MEDREETVTMTVSQTIKGIGIGTIYWVTLFFSVSDFTVRMLVWFCRDCCELQLAFKCFGYKVYKHSV